MTTPLSLAEIISMVEWDEIIYIVLGAVIGLFSSAAILILERMLERKGKIAIFYKRTSQVGSGGLGWGFEDGIDGRLYFVLPIIYELQNTSNSTRVIRDVSLLLYSGKKYVGKMAQVDEIKVEHRKGKVFTGEEKYELGSDKGSYSFVLQPRSIQRQKCEYMFKISPSQKDANMFDRVLVRYYDEKNKAHLYSLMIVDNCWVSQTYDEDDEWNLLEDKICRFFW